MPIDETPVAAWTETDLGELIGRRETPQREFKQSLSLATDPEKKEAEHDVQGVANAGGGFVIYGIAEKELEDRSKVARELTPLIDGGLYEQLNNVLDGRGEPKVPFDLHLIDAAAGGFYLVVDVYGRRRPHMAQDGRYYTRRNLLVRRMTEAEVADAYRERFAREGLAAGGTPEPDRLAETADAVERRVHQGLTAQELALYRQETGGPGSPGWLSVFAHPIPLQPNLLDPVEYNEWSFHDIDMEDRWRRIETPLRHFVFERTLNGFRAQLPPRDDTYPRYLFQFSPDGVFEFGTLLESAFREEGRGIPSHAVAQYVHDGLLLFARIYRLAGYDGQVRANARLDHIAGYDLIVDPARRLWDGLHRIQENTIQAQPWAGTVVELEESGCTEIARDFTNRVFLAAGAGQPYFFDHAGNYVE